MSDIRPFSKTRKWMTKMPHRKSYAVGHGKPPESTRFKPGQSGNPKGRPKGKKNRREAPRHERLKSIILEEAYRTIKFNDGAAQVSVPVAQAVMRSLAVTAAKGNTVRKSYSRNCFPIRNCPTSRPTVHCFKPWSNTRQNGTWNSRGASSKPSLPFQIPCRTPTTSLSTTAETRHLYAARWTSMSWQILIFGLGAGTITKPS